MDTRDQANAQLATSASGKRYNADLNGALNLAARGLALLLGVKKHPDRETAGVQSLNAVTGKSSGTVTRMPWVLADVWAYVQAAGPLTAPV